jgi:peptide/nickel transport system permease protein
MASTSSSARRPGPLNRSASVISRGLPFAGHPTLRYALGRIVAAVGLLLVASVVIFMLEHLAPGSPETVLLGGRPSTPQLLASIRHEYHLDEPLLTQYWHWLTGALHGNFGESITFKSSVSSVIGARMGATIELGIYAAFITTIFGVALGVIAALRAGRFTDSAISLLVVVLASISGYVSAIILLVVFAVNLGWFPILGTGNPGTDRLYHLTLPAIALAIALIALIARTTRASVARTLDVEFVDTARSRGLSERRIFAKHVFRNSLIPILTVSGLVVGYLISGAVLVEYTFGLNGLGSLLVQSVEGKDYAVVQGVTLLFTAVFIFVNLIVDLLYGLVDPRVRLGQGVA